MVKLKRKVYFLILISTLIISCVCLSSVVFAQSSNPLPSQIFITVDTLGYDSEDMPNAVEGATYPVFDYFAQDNLGNKIDSVQVLVYFDTNKDTNVGNTDDDILVAVNEGRFRTEREGLYIIEYNLNFAHLSARKRIYVNALDSQEYVSPTYSLNKNMTDAAKTGEFVYVLDGSIDNDVRFGKAELTQTIRYEGDYQCEEVELLGSDEFVKYFVPQVAGDYVITYTVTDILGKDKAIFAEQVVSVYDDAAPQLTSPVFSPVAYKNEVFTLPRVEAIQYKDGEIYYIPVKVFVGQEDVSSSMQFTPIEEGVLTVTYQAESIYDDSVKAVYTKDVVVYDKLAKTNYVISKYLKLDGFVESFRKTSDSEYLEKKMFLLTADGSQRTASASFKNAISTKYLSLELGVDTPKSNFNSIFINFIDSKNSNQKICLELFEKIVGDNYFIEVYLNGKLVNTLADKVFSYVDNDFTKSKFYITYDENTKSIVDKMGNKLCDVFTYESGQVFEGFSSGKAYITFGIDGITGESQIKFCELATQLVTDDKKDETLPLFLIPDEYAELMRVEHNYPTKIMYIDAFDVYDFNLSVFVKIFNSLGEIVFEQKITEDIYYTFTDYDSYEVRYVAIDSGENEVELKTFITVVDRIAPKITAPKLKSQIKVNDTIEFPNYSVKDNSGKDCVKFIYVIDTKGSLITINDNKYKFKEKGTYVVNLCAMDESGNTTSVEYVVTCE